ncbi:MAG: holo-[acyl-carrier protein] synthase [Alphaproteobacteria bacterium]|jgi:holo-[acyl-carrier protein] synthase
MIFGIGTDIVEIDRIKKAIQASERFALRILTVYEMTEYSINKYPSRYLAKKFAAKEALVKAMGTGIGNGYSWQMIQVEHTELGKPFFVFNGAVEEFMSTHHITNCQLSISDEQNYAMAMVVLEAV